MRYIILIGLNRGRIMVIGNRLKNLRERSGLTQNALAEAAGVSQTHLRRVELGNADITVGHLQLVCDALGVSLAEFFETCDETDEISVAAAKLTPRQRSLLAEFIKSI